MTTHETTTTHSAFILILVSHTCTYVRQVWLAHNLMAVDSSKLLAGGKAEKLSSEMLQLGERAVDEDAKTARYRRF